MVALSIAVMWFASAVICRTDTASLVLLLWSVLPPAWEMRAMSWQRCGVKGLCEHIQEHLHSAYIQCTARVYTECGPC